MRLTGPLVWRRDLTVRSIYPIPRKAVSGGWFLLAPKFCLLLLLMASCGAQTPGSDEDASILQLGEDTYQRYCLACHQMDGSGVPGMYPPLRDTDWVTGEKERLIEIVMNGLSGTIEVNGEVYNQEMAASEFLSDEEIAAVLTYIRVGFGNDSSSVSSAEVASIRKELNRSVP